MRSIDQAAQTVFADLNQRCLDAAFDEQFPANGNFTLVKVKGRDYWYYNSYDALTGKKEKKYVGPASNEAVSARAQAFTRVKVGFRARLDAVRMLRSAGFPSPDGITGSVVERMARVGFFRLRGVLVGTVAFQTYPGLVGARPERHLQTGDVDLAQDHGIAVGIGEVADPLIDEPRSLDTTFREVPHQADRRHSTAFINDRGYKVEFLVPNRGSDEDAGKPTRMPTLQGVSAQPLRFLDFLIKSPARSVLLHSGGISVAVPAPERYAVHKMIVSTRRRDTEKSSKDLGQAAFLIEAMTSFRSAELVDVWIEAWDRGPKWRACLIRSKSNLPNDARQRLDDAIRVSSVEFERRPEEVGVV